MIYYKLFNADLTDYSEGYVYSKGINVIFNHDECDDSNKCKYNNYGHDFEIYNLEYVFNNLYMYNTYEKVYIGICKLSEDAKFKLDKKIILTDKFYLESIQDLEEYFNINPDMRIIAIKQSGYAIRFIQDQTPELCIIAVRDSSCLKYIKQQTPEICLEAIKHNSWQLEYVLEQTPKLCIIAVTHSYQCKQLVKPEFYKYIKDIIAEYEKSRNIQYTVTNFFSLSPDMLLDKKQFKTLSERFASKTERIKSQFLEPRYICPYPCNIPEIIDDKLYDELHDVFT